MEVEDEIRKLKVESLVQKQALMYGLAIAFKDRVSPETVDEIRSAMLEWADTKIESADGAQWVVEYARSEIEELMGTIRRPLSNDA